MVIKRQDTGGRVFLAAQNAQESEQAALLGCPGNRITVNIEPAKNDEADDKDRTKDEK